MSAALPPLPTPKGKIFFEPEPYEQGWISSSDAFDDDQMQAYASQARADLEAENKRLREALDEIAINTHDDTAERVARAALESTK